MIPHECQSDIPIQIAQLMERMRRHDDDLYAHSLLVGSLSLTFAAHLGFPLRDQRLLGQAALLHDVGKLRIDRRILQKPTTLNEREWSIIRTHPSLGIWILLNEGIRNPVVLDIVGNHHERLDGTGYPAGLSARQLSEATRVVTLCDVFAALTETRRYGKPHTRQDALERMARKRTRLDLDLLKHFKVMIEAHCVRDSAERGKISASCYRGGEICPKAS
ncbi:HD-GYP domain-containing protein [Terriglobus sp. ADX1]|uniref:HD-GYP domain-containing protein n=1 Tax=Terriglobus sp. ADX1 TaxID=2794063 RepID=UPI002FE5E22A